MRHAAFLTLCCLVTPLLAQSTPEDAAANLDVEFTVQQPSGAAATSYDLFDTPIAADSDDNEPRTARTQRRSGKKTVPNPFDLPSEGGGYGAMDMMMGEDMGDMMDMEEGMGGMEMGMEDEMGMGSMGMGYGGGEMYGDGGDSTSPADRRFQIGLQRAIQALRNSKSEADQKALLDFVRQAFQNRYDESIQSRRKQLNQIKERVAKLEGELKRREAAKSRVVEVQLQSVQLAAEGLLELDGQ